MSGSFEDFTAARAALQDDWTNRQNSLLKDLQKKHEDFSGILETYRQNLAHENMAFMESVLQKGPTQKI